VTLRPGVLRLIRSRKQPPRGEVSQAGTRLTPGRGRIPDPSVKGRAMAYPALHAAPPPGGIPAAVMPEDTGARAAPAASRRLP
jgi:hypothetical protein